MHVVAHFLQFSGFAVGRSLRARVPALVRVWLVDPMRFYDAVLTQYLYRPSARLQKLPV